MTEIGDIMDIKELCRKLSFNESLSWYDDHYMKDIQDWMVDDMLDMSSFNATREDIEKYLDVAIENIIKKARLVRKYMSKEIVDEVKELIDEMVREGYTDEEEQEE